MYDMGIYVENSRIQVRVYYLVLEDRKYIGIHFKIAVWITLLRVDSTILCVDFYSKNEVIPKMTPKTV